MLAALFLYNNTSQIDNDVTPLSLTRPLQRSNRTVQSLPGNFSLQGNSLQPGYHATQHPIHHVFYLKTHKTGSTTMFSILAEYCRSHDLLPLLPSKGQHFNVFRTYNPDTDVWRHPGLRVYDMMFNHHIFDRRILQHLHNDTFRFTTIREPFQQFVSTFQFFINNFKDVPGPDRIGTFLSDPVKYDSREGRMSLVNNRQSMDLGYDMTHGFTDTEYIKQFIQQITEDFHLVLISDFYDESVVLLRRKLRWRTQDMLYFRKWEAKRKSRVADNLSNDTQRALHKRYAAADWALYQHFLKIFKDQISNVPGLHEEVKEFKDVLQQVVEFCDSGRDDFKQLIIPPGQWTDQVSIIRSKCKWLKMNGRLFTLYLRNSTESRLAD